MEIVKISAKTKPYSASRYLIPRIKNSSVSLLARGKEATSRALNAIYHLRTYYIFQNNDIRFTVEFNANDYPSLRIVPIFSSIDAVKTGMMMKVSARTPFPKLAIAISKALREGKNISLIMIGKDATYICMKGLALATDILKRDNLKPVCTISYPYDERISKYITNITVTCREKQLSAQ